MTSRPSKARRSGAGWPKLASGLRRVPPSIAAIFVLWAIAFATLWQVRDHPGHKLLDYLLMLDQSSTETLQLLVNALSPPQPPAAGPRFAIVTLGDGFDSLATHALAPKDQVAQTLTALRQSGARSVLLDILIAVRADPAAPAPTQAELALARALADWAADPAAPQLLLVEAQQELDSTTTAPPGGFRPVETFLPLPGFLQDAVRGATNIHLVNAELVTDADGVVRRFERVVARTSGAESRLQATAAFALHGLARGCPPGALDQSLNGAATAECQGLRDLVLGTPGRSPQRLPIRYGLDGESGAVLQVSSEAVNNYPVTVQGMDVILRSSSFYLLDIYPTPVSSKPMTGSLVIANTALSDLQYPNPTPVVWVAIPSFLGLCLYLFSDGVLERLAVARLGVLPATPGRSGFPTLLLTALRLLAKLLAFCLAVGFLGVAFWAFPQLRGEPGLSLPSLGSLLAGLLITSESAGKRGSK